MVGHRYIIFISKLYSGIFILPSVLTPSMRFVYLIWENKKGESMTALFQKEKAEFIAEQMRSLGVKVQLSPGETTDIIIN